MTWENYATNWHIDHIMPLSSFDLSRKDQVLIACNWTNMRPLLKKENLSKGSKITDPQINFALDMGTLPNKSRHAV